MFKIGRPWVRSGAMKARGLILEAEEEEEEWEELEEDFEEEEEEWEEEEEF